jgi:predicted DNA-binding transcriptional regulator YafY
MPVTKNKAIRFKLLDSFLRDIKGYTLKELEKKINENLDANQISERTLREDLKEIGGLIEIEKDKNKRYRYKDPHESFFYDTIDPRIIELIQQLYHFFPLAKNSELYEKLGIELQDFIRGELIQKQQDGLGTSFIQIGNAVKTNDIQWIEQIYDAILNKQTLEIYYRSINKHPLKITICPYLLKEFDNEWFVIAYSFGKIDDNQTTNVFKLKRIESIANSEQEYLIDPEFNPETYFNHCIGRYHVHNKEPEIITLRAHQKLRALLKEKPLHQTMEIIDDNAIEEFMDFKIKVYDNRELLLKIIGYGKHLQVLEPQTLRKKVFHEIHHMLYFYKDLND